MYTCEFPIGSKVVAIDSWDGRIEEGREYTVTRHYSHNHKTITHIGINNGGRGLFLLRHFKKASRVVRSI